MNAEIFSVGQLFADTIGLPGGGFFCFGFWVENVCEVSSVCLQLEVFVHCQ